VERGGQETGRFLGPPGLKGVSTPLYEAAGLAGVNKRKNFWKITFPQLTPIIFFNAIMGIIGSLQEFDRVYVMKPSNEGPIGPDDSMLTPVYLLFKNGFSFFKMGYASSLAWMLFAIILALTIFQLKMAPRWVHYETESS